MKRQLERVEMYIEEGRKSGADLVTGGQRPAHLNKGYFIEPTLFANVDNTAASPGGDLRTRPVPDPGRGRGRRDPHRQRIELRPQRLGADHRPQAAYDISRRIRTGVMGQNGMRMEFGMPFGGFKQSGIGREGGEEGLWPYVETKTILLDGRRGGCEVGDSWTGGRGWMMIPESFHSASDDLPWADRLGGRSGIKLKLLMADIEGGRYAVRMLFAPGVEVFPHKHSGEVHAFTFAGSWRYLEYPDSPDNRAGSYLFEPPGSTHTLKVADDAECPTDVLFVMYGALLHLGRTARWWP
jgi:hypothetical protein